MEINWTVLTYFIVAIFAINGFSKGWWKEGITTAFLALLVFMLEQPPFAEGFIGLINAALALVWSVAPQFFEGVFLNVFSVEMLDGAMFQLDGSIPETWLMILVATVVISLVVGRSTLPGHATTSAGGFLGGLLGGFNGFVILNLVREYIYARNLPGRGIVDEAITGQAVSGSVANSGVTIQAVELPAYTILDGFLPWLIMIVGLLLLLTILRTRVGYSYQDGFAKINYKNPYGYRKA